MNSGAISFDKEEVKFQLDKKNNPKGLFFKKSKESNKLIEEFMLLANKKVAEFINSKKPKKTFIYRVHDTPDLQKLQSLKKISKQFGYDLNISNPTQINSSLNKILKDVIGDGKTIFLEGRHEVEHAIPTFQKSIDILGFNHDTDLKEGLSVMWSWAQNQPKRNQFIWPSYELDRGLYSYWENPSKL